MSELPDRRPLLGTTVRLDPVAVADADGLFAALDDPRVYAAGFGGGPAGRPASVTAMADWLAAAVADHRRVAPYTVRMVVDGPAGPAGAIVGTSSLGDC